MESVKEAASRCDVAGGIVPVLGALGRFREILSP